MRPVTELDDMVTPATLARLRRTKREAEAGDAWEGDRDGRDWALHRAEWRQLQALEELAIDFEDVARLDCVDDYAEYIACVLAKQLRVRHGEMYDVDELREALFPEPARRYSAHYTVAFIQSAAAVFREAVEQI